MRLAAQITRLNKNKFENEVEIIVVFYIRKARGLTKICLNLEGCIFGDSTMVVH